MSTNNIVPFPEKEDKYSLLYECSCVTEEDNENGLTTVFYIYLDRYECYHCGKEHSFESVHGSID